MPPGRMVPRLDETRLEDNQILTLFFSFFFDMKTLFVHHLAISTERSKEDTLEELTLQRTELGSVRTGQGVKGGMASRSAFAGSFFKLQALDDFWASVRWYFRASTPLRCSLAFPGTGGCVTKEGQLERHR